MNTLSTRTPTIRRRGSTAWTLRHPVTSTVDKTPTAFVARIAELKADGAIVIECGGITERTFGELETVHVTFDQPAREEQRRQRMGEGNPAAGKDALDPGAWLHRASLASVVDGRRVPGRSHAGPVRGTTCTQGP